MTTKLVTPAKLFLILLALVFWIGCQDVATPEEEVVLPSAPISTAPVQIGPAESTAESPATAPPAATDITIDVEDREGWNVLYIGDTRAGYGRSKVVTVEGIIHAEQETNMIIKRFGQELKTRSLLKTRETPQGELLDFSFTLLNPPAAPVKTEGHVEGTELTLTSTTNGKSTKKTIPWDPTVRSPLYPDLQLQTNPIKVGETRKFRAFQPEFAQVAEVIIQATGRKPVELLDGTSRELLQVDMTTRIKLGTIPQDIVLKASVDDEGQPQRSVVELGGLQMTTYAVSREEAMKSIEGEELDLAVHTLVKVDPIPAAHQSRKIVYRLHVPGGKPIDFIPKGSTQEVIPVNAETVELTVTALSGPPESPEQPAEIADEFLKPASLLQSNDERVMELAAEGVGEESDPWKQAVLLENFVHTKLTEKNFSTALGSAAEVARTMSGDCTEHACLLAALCRAEEIPSRIAVGLVYVNSLNSFGGHMWTEVHVNGEWIPLDATLGRGGIGAAHIKLADSSFADEGITPVSCFLPLMNILGKLEIEVVKVNP